MATSRKPRSRTAKLPAPWDENAKRPRCREAVFGTNRAARPYGCPCRNEPEHATNHECSCGAQWARGGGGELIVIVATPYPGICGWSG